MSQSILVFPPPWHHVNGPHVRGKHPALGSIFRLPEQNIICHVELPEDARAIVGLRIAHGSTGYPIHAAIYAGYLVRDDGAKRRVAHNQGTSGPDPGRWATQLLFEMTTKARASKHSAVEEVDSTGSGVALTTVRSSYSPVSFWLEIDIKGEGGVEVQPVVHQVVIDVDV